MNALMGSDLYLLHRDKKGNTWIQHHRTWNAPDCFQHQRDAARKEGGDVELSTEADYEAARRARK